jgi:hypothetical protein
MKEYLEEDFMSLDDHTIASIGIVTRAYIDILRKYRLYGRIIFPFIGIITRTANLSSNISNEIWSFDFGIDVFLIHYIFAFAGVKYDYYRANPNSLLSVNSSRNDGNYNILHHKGALFFYIGASLYFSWNSKK